MLSPNFGQGPFPEIAGKALITQLLVQMFDFSFHFSNVS